MMQDKKSKKIQNAKQKGLITDFISSGNLRLFDSYCDLLKTNCAIANTSSVLRNQLRPFIINMQADGITEPNIMVFDESFNKVFYVSLFDFSLIAQIGYNGKENELKDNYNAIIEWLSLDENSIAACYSHEIICDDNTFIQHITNHCDYYAYTPSLVPHVKETIERTYGSLDGAYKSIGIHLFGKASTLVSLGKKLSKMIQNSKKAYLSLMFYYLKEFSWVKRLLPYSICLKLTDLHKIRYNENKKRYE